MPSRYDDKTNTFVNYLPDSRDPHKLSSGDVNVIHEDPTGTLWMGASDGLYRYNRHDETFTRYTETRGYPEARFRAFWRTKPAGFGSVPRMGYPGSILKRKRLETTMCPTVCRRNEFSHASYAQSPDGEMSFGGSNGFDAFYPEAIRDSPYTPPVVITSFKIFNKTVRIGARSVLTKAIPYVDLLTLSYRESVFSFEFAALSRSLRDISACPGCGNAPN